MATKTKQAESKPKPFSRLSKAEKRIAIARDVLLQIRKNKIIPKHNTYCNIDYWSNPNISRQDSLQKRFKELGTFNCSVCAKGAILISDVLFRNKMTIVEVNSADSRDIVRKLDGIFSEGQLDTIEAAFESRIINDGQKILWSREEGYRTVPTELGRKAILFCDNIHGNPKERLRKIMKNLIKNNGEFKP